ncbi:MAG: L-seryl-tRNA(Sec) selenium transferase [Jatrophihabitans sp.]|uniref:L-seryl-tRNA(Sec) selenium transferase n=1 Tax=Jatrophihabitans sp. TaxID=1932789 RepID=UPI003F7EE6FC
MSDPRRLVPRTDAVLADPRIVEATRRFGRARVKRAVTAGLQLVRDGRIAPDDVADEVLAALGNPPSALRAVINATGVVLHTNLGRAPLGDAAREAVAAAAGYVDVEYDLGTGRRARRGRGALAALTRAVPGADAALVVNNGAAALVLATTALAAGREVVISRGELVEIGDGFRLPDLITSTGARLREVGTTNRVTLADYAAAIGPDTGCILKVHPSNFRIEGFTSSVVVRDLAGLGVPVVVDTGSGLLAPHPLLPDEPDVASAVAAGAALVTASGDKLLGGPQAGLVLGEAAAVEQLRRHPLARALRVDKLTLAALEATLRGPLPPVAATLHAEPAALRARTERLAAALGRQVVEVAGAVGGGAAPGMPLPGVAVELPPGCAEPLRLGEPPVVARVERGRCLVDLRCIPAESDGALEAALRSVLAVVPAAED